MNKQSEHIQNISFKILLAIFLGVLAWLSQLYFVSIDWSNNQRNSLTEDSIRLINTLDSKLTFSLVISPQHEHIALLNDLLKRYQYQQPLIIINKVNPDLSPELLRQHDIRQDGVVLIEYNQKVEKVNAISERNITNAIQRLIRQEERWIVFLEGHGERHPYGDANHDISTFSAQLASKGFIIESLNLTKVPEIPNNTQVLVIASPLTEFLPGEIDIISEYVESGGNLLWLVEPNETQNLEPLAEQLNIDFLPGVIVDPNTQVLGLKRFDYALVNDYAFHPITEYLSAIAIFPQATALFKAENDTVWQNQKLLETQANTWNETGELKGEITVGDNSDESLGPLTLGLTLNRTVEFDDNSINQRIIVIGDGDFLANQFLGNGANAELGFNMINWLSHDDSLIAINAKSAPDTELILSDNQKIILTVNFLIIMPIIFLTIGFRIWLKRKNS